MLKTRREGPACTDGDGALLALLAGSGDGCCTGNGGLVPEQGECCNCKGLMLELPAGLLAAVLGATAALC